MSTKEIQVPVCEWSIDAEGTWGGTCGAEWVFNDGGPTDNSMKFCPECGKPLKELPAKYDEWGDPIAGCDCNLLENPFSPQPCADFRADPSNPELCVTCTHVEECH